MISQVKNLVAYLLGKTSEIGDLDKKDILLAKVILDIHRKKSGTEFILVPLYSLKPIHAIDRENALSATEKRVEVVTEMKRSICEKKKVTRDVLAEYLPSVSWIKVVKENDDSYIAYEGNGRLMAMQKVFIPSDGILVEVEEYRFRKTDKILRRMNRVRKMNGLIE